MQFPRRTFFIIVLSAVIFSGTSCERHAQPIYNGKPLSKWIADLNPQKPDATRDQAQIVIRQIGTNSIPFLIGEMRELGSLWEKMGATNFNNSDELTDRLVNLRDAFETLGPIAKPAVPALVILLNSPTNGANDGAAYALTQIDAQIAVGVLTHALTNQFAGARISAANELYEVRSNADMAVPNLIQCLKDNSAEKEASSMLRYCSAAALGFIESSPEKAIPALAEALLQDKNSAVRLAAARSLGQFGKNAQSAILALTQASTNDPESFVRRAAAIALNKIQEQSP